MEDTTRMRGVGFEQGRKMAPAASPERPAQMNLYVICIFNINKEGFNGVSSTKRDIYFALGCVWFADPSFKGNGHHRLFKTNHRLALEFPFSVLSPHVSIDTRSRFIYTNHGLTKRLIGCSPSTSHFLLRNLDSKE